MNLLTSGTVLSHPFVIGEITLGGLLAAVRLSAGATLWTRDKRRRNVARELSLTSL